MSSPQNERPVAPPPTPRGFIAFHRSRGHAVNFFIDEEADEIQRQNARGQFYEVDELERLLASVGKGARILDVGANVGNHMLYFAIVMNAASVVPIEPSPRLAKHVAAHAELNFLKNVDLRFLGKAFGAGPGRGRLTVIEGNLGASKILRENAGDVEIIDADTALGDRKFDFVKIDVEGFEIDVLKGMSKIISTCKPLMYVEVNTHNDARFDAWLATTKYKIKWSHKRYKDNINHFIEWKD